jgi:hypothetical protein
MERSPANRIDANDSSQLAGSTAQALLEQLNHMDSENSSRSNVIIGIGSVVLTLVVPRLEVAPGSAQWGAAGLVVIAIGALLAVVNAVVTLKPASYSSKHTLNLMYPGSYLRKMSKGEYAEKLVQLFQHDRTILTSLAYELYAYGGTVMTQARRLERSIYILVSSLALGALFQGIGWMVER